MTNVVVRDVVLRIHGAHDLHVRTSVTEHLLDLCLQLFVHVFQLPSDAVRGRKKRRVRAHLERPLSTP